MTSEGEILVEVLFPFSPKVLSKDTFIVFPFTLVTRYFHRFPLNFYQKTLSLESYAQKNKALWLHRRLIPAYGYKYPIKSNLDL